MPPQWLWEFSFWPEKCTKATGENGKWPTGQPLHVQWENEIWYYVTWKLNWKYIRRETLLLVSCPTGTSESCNCNRLPQESLWDQNMSHRCPLGGQFLLSLSSAREKRMGVLLPWFDFHQNYLSGHNYNVIKYRESVWDCLLGSIHLFYSLYQQKEIW